MSWPIQLAALLLYFAVLGLAIVALSVALAAAGHWLREHLNL